MGMFVFTNSFANFVSFHVFCLYSEDVHVDIIVTLIFSFSTCGFSINELSSSYHFIQIFSKLCRSVNEYVVWVRECKLFLWKRKKTLTLDHFVGHLHGRMISCQ